jgi:16S rRNA (guanine(527)-N(7))-methyltransferase RsmG
VCKADPLRQQGDAAVRKCPFGAVAAVAQDGTADGGHLSADLVPAAGFQQDFQQAAGGAAFQEAIRQCRLAGFFSGLCGPAQPAFAFQLVHQASLLPGGASLHDSQVVFFDTTLSELSAQACGGFGGAGKNDDAGHRGIQSVDQADKYASGFCVTLFEPEPGQIDQVGFVRFIALHNQSRWFIKHQQVIVFVKHGPARMKKIHKQRSFSRSESSRVAAPSLQAMGAIFDACGIRLSARQLDCFWVYHGLLRLHNSDLNLTRVHNFSNMVLKLYVDSALPALMTDLPSPLMDLGSGPGMPGIPLKILRPEVEIVLAEGRAKRTAFLREAIERLQLTGIEVVDRNIGPEFERPVNGVITRAVETIDQTLSRVQGCLQRHGRVIFMKGPACEPEIELALRLFDQRFALVDNQEYRIGSTSHERRLVVFERLDAPPRALAAQAARRHRVLEVTSEHNDRYKSLKRILTGRGIRKEGLALMAGGKTVMEMLTAFPQRCRAWITSGAQPAPPVEASAEMDWLQLAEPLFQTLDLFGTRAPLLCIDVPEIEPWTPAEGFPDGCSLLVPFQDPENVGAVIRSAAAFEAAQVILLAESAHPYHPKALRAAGGLTPRVRLRQGPSLHELPTDLPLYALSAQGTRIATVDFPDKFGLLIGLEGQGLPQAFRDKAVRIPIHPAVDSLNAAATAAVALYEWRKR